MADSKIVNLAIKAVIAATDEFVINDVAGGNIDGKVTAAAIKAFTETSKLDDFAAPDDTTDLDATTLLHGLMPKVDKSKLDGVATGAEVNPDLISQAEAEAGSATTERIFNALRVKQAIDALAVGGKLELLDSHEAIGSATSVTLTPASTVTEDTHSKLILVYNYRSNASGQLGLRVNNISTITYHANGYRMTNTPSLVALFDDSATSFPIATTTLLSTDNREVSGSVEIHISGLNLIINFQSIGSQQRSTATYEQWVGVQDGESDLSSLVILGNWKLGTQFWLYGVKV